MDAHCDKWFSLFILAPPPNLTPITRSMEKSNFPAPKSQDLVRFRKEIEQNNMQKVYEYICLNPRYLVSSGDTPSILKEGPRYNALHIAAMHKHARMTKLILQTVEQTQFIEHLHGITNDPIVEVMCQNLLESYLNTPDKSRNETPLHFAAKVGAVDVIEVLISYPICKMKANFEGLYPKDVICVRAPDTPVEVKKAIEALLNERFFVPVMRSSDGSILPVIGDPFTPSQMPSSPTNPRYASMEIKAYAGPMSSEQAKTFQKRWKTPPRLIPSSTTSTNSHNLSFSPKSSTMSSPLHSPRMTKSFNILQSTPKLKKRLFDNNTGAGDYDEDFESVYLSNVTDNDNNGNRKVTILDEQEEEEFKELFDDLMRDKINHLEEVTGKYRNYRNPEPAVPETPTLNKNDSNSNHLMHNYNSYSRLNSNDSQSSLFNNPPSGSLGSALITSFLDESGSVFSQENIHDSISFKEKNIRLTDTKKGLEKIGRGLADEYNVGWKEYWDFLGQFIDIRSSEGMERFEEFLKKRDKQKEINESEAQSSPVTVKNESFGLSAICAGLYSMDINDEINNAGIKPKNGFTSPTTSRSPLIEMLTSKRPSSDDLPLDNPFTCIEQSCRTFAKRLAALLESETIQDQSSYEKILLAEVNKLNTSIDSYKRDARFSTINFQKVHARYSYLLVWYLKCNNVNVKYLRNAVPLMSKVYNLARQFTSLQNMRDLIKTHSVCISNFTTNCIEHEERVFNPENVNTETGCFDAWNGPDIVECKCSFEANFVSTKQKLNHRRDIRKRLYSGSSIMKVIDLWSVRTPSRDFEEDADESYLSCDSDDSANDEWFTPPQSPRQIESSDDEMNAFEESLEYVNDLKIYSLFVDG